MSKLPKSIQEYLGRIGRKGGSTTGPTKARDPEKCAAAGRKGALSRWAKVKAAKEEAESSK